MAIGRDSGEGTLSGRSNTYFTTERLKRNLDAGSKLSPTIGHTPELECGLRELVGKQTESRDERSPAPCRGLQIQELDLQGVSRACPLDKDGPIYLVHTREVKCTDRGDG